MERTEVHQRYRARKRGEHVAPAQHDTRRRDWRERFIEKVDVRGSDECWPWLGAVNKVTGYGVFGRGPGKRLVGAHVAAVEYFTGEAPPDGQSVDHVKERGCTRRDCVNPAHLEVVSITVNVLRGSSPPAQNARKTHCPKGSPVLNTCVR